MNEAQHFHECGPLTPAADSPFQATKDLVVSAALLAHPLAHAPLSILCDASGDSTATALEQCQDGMLEL